MSQPRSVVVVGAGQAGGELAADLRSAGYSGTITVLGAEPEHPYTRPPLSKAYLLGTVGPAEVMLRAPSMYVQHEIDLRLGVTVTAIDPSRKQVTLDDGNAVEYSNLVLATGGRARRLPTLALEAAANVHYMRTLQDATRLRSQFEPGRRLVIVGGGYIGLEIASVAQRRGLAVTVIEAETRVLARVATPPISAFFQRIHAEEGVDIRLGTTLEDCAMDRHGNVQAVRLSNGDVINCGLVLVGIGLVPNTELAEAAGLVVQDGIVVDHLLRTSDPHVYAIGDVARYPDPDTGILRRLESVPNALEQAKAVAESIVGRPQPYASVPRFWSDQYDVKLQLVGLATADHDEVVVRGDLASGRQFGVFYLKDGVVCSAALANSPREFAVARRLVAERVAIDPRRLADASIPPRDLIASAHSR